MGAPHAGEIDMKAYLPHLSPHRWHVLLACIVALVLLTLPAEVLSRSAAAVLAG